MSAPPLESGIDEIRFKNPALERVSDYLNPLLVKETRQSLKSRGFLTVFSLMLLGCWCISMFGFLFSGEGIRYGSYGRNFFIAYYWVLAIATFMIVPNMAYRSMIIEREFQTYEMLQITTLNPKRIIWGKWWSAIVQMLVYYAAISPFMVLSSFLRGLSIFSIAYIIVWSMIGSACLSMVSLASATMSRNKQSNAVLGVVTVIGGLWLSGGASLALSGTLMMGELPFDEPGFWAANLVALTFLAPAFVLVRQIATVSLLFEGANRSTGPRLSSFTLTMVGILWLSAVIFGWPRYLLGTWWTGATSFSTGDVYGFTCCFLFWLVVLGLFATTEDTRFSRRVRRDLPRSTGARLLMLPFLPGAGRGWLFIHIQVALVALIMYSMIISSTSINFDEALRFPVMAISYLYFYLGLTSFLGRQLRRLSSEIIPNHIRILGLLLFAGGSFGPHLLEIYEWDLGRQIPILFITDPFSTLLRSQATYGQQEGWLVLPVAALGVVGFTLNLGVLFSGIREALTAPVAIAHRPETLAESQPAVEA